MMGFYVTLVILFISTTYYGVQGFKKNILYAAEDHVKSKIFHDTTRSKLELFIECMDIHKQPALNHHMLRDHKIQMEPNFKIERDGERSLTQTKDAIFQSFEDSTCPNGTVPIQRNKNGLVHPLTFNHPRQHFATFNTNSTKDTYHGADAFVTIEQPAMVLGQFSGGSIWIQNGNADDYNLIAIGWMVNPELYGDNLSRFTGLWQGNDFHGGCYNTLCPGFIQIHPIYHLGQQFSAVSTLQESFGLRITVLQDVISGNWWLTIDGDKQIGYWPKELFTTLTSGTPGIAFGGITYTPPRQSSPPMGRGSFPTPKIESSSYFSHIRIANADYQFDDINFSSMTKFVDSEKCYGVTDLAKTTEEGWIFFYGGPGGENCGI